MKRRSLALALLAPMLLSACTIAKISGRGSMPLILNNPSQRVQVVEHFVESKRIMFDYTSSFDVSEVLGNALKQKNGDAVANLTITLKTTVPDFFINLVTLGFAQSKVFQVEGDLIKTGGNIGALMQDATVVAEADANGVLKANLADFSSATESPMVVQTEAGLVLVKANR